MRCAAIFLLASMASAQTWVMQPSGTTASLRGISVVDEKTAWASGTGGTYLRTIDGGKTWTAAVVPGAEKLDFRGVVAFDAAHAILMSSGEGALSTLYSTADAGKTWALLFHNPDEKGFFDAIAFDREDPKCGALLGDPVNGTFALFATADRGQTWQRMKSPAALTGEGAFAASNSSLIVRDEWDGCHFWFATGGPGAARVFHYPDRGKTWVVYKTPIRNDSAGAGIFSIALTAGYEAVIVGGDYAKPKQVLHNAAMVRNVNIAWKQDWSEPEVPPRGYRSSVVYLFKGHIWLTTGPTGSEYSRDLGQNWTPFDDGAFNAIGGRSALACWAVGPKGRIAKLEFASPSTR